MADDVLREWPQREALVGLRQWPVLESIAVRVARASEFAGAALLGSMARGEADALSDVDLLLVTAAGAFESAWARRHELSDGALVAWEKGDRRLTGVAGHAWITPQLVFVECLVAEPASEVRLAEPFVPIVGEDAVFDGVGRRPPIDRSEMTLERPHEVDAAYEALKDAIRRNMG
jgi:predicted nucleotidyltransferase